MSGKTTLSPETRVSLKASQFWAIVVTVGGAAAYMTAQSSSLATLRRDHDAEVEARMTADREILADQKELAKIMLELRGKIAAPQDR
mgnify:CR=1 FL=1